MVVTQTVPGLSEIIQRIGGIVPGSGYSLESIKAYTAGWGLITYIPTVARRTTVTVTYSENSQQMNTEDLSCIFRLYPLKTQF